MYRNSWLMPLLLLPLLLLLLAGCVRLEREFPEKDFFSLEAARSGESAPTPLFDALQLEKMDVSTRFRGKLFVYRTGDLQYEEDFYNQFFAAPGELISEETARWLRASGLFTQVYTRPAPVIPDHYLDGSVSALYGDFRGRPQAVLEIGFTLVREEGAESRMLLRRDYRREIALRERTPAALAAGWSRALEEILAEFEQDLRAGR